MNNTACGTPPSGLHWSHSDATERSGDRESIGGGLRSNQRVNHAIIATKETDRISSLEIAPSLRQLPSFRSRFIHLRFDASMH